MSDKKRSVLLATGMSGAGRTAAVKALEDLGYEAVDNLPLNFILPLLRSAVVSEDGGPAQPIVLAVDIRTRDFDENSFIRTVDQLASDRELSVQVLFLDCVNEVLLRRFAETRRRHPLAEDRPVTDGIDRERELLAPLRRRADLVVDTSNLPARELKHLLASHFAIDGRKNMSISVLSFSYREGLPRQADLVFDVRFLKNPHYVDGLREQTGQQQAVVDYIAGDEAFSPFMKSMSDLILSLLPRYQSEGKSYLTIAIGCTGGRHRSVAVTEELTKRLNADGYDVYRRHRELGVEG
jgi:UPF0042 nucleotide-binding protein